MSQISLDQLPFLPENSFYLTVNGKICDDWRLIKPNDPYRVCLRVLGGKGGFGSLLRSFRIFRSTNQGMMRDLSGRRMKDVKEETKLKKWISKAAEREEEKQKKREEKYRKLKAGPPKHEFTDVEFSRTRDEILEKTEDALEQGLKAADAVDEDQPGSSGITDRKRHAPNNGVEPKVKKSKVLWLGVDVDSSDEEEDGDGEQLEKGETGVHEENVEENERKYVEKLETTTTHCPVIENDSQVNDVKQQTIDNEEKEITDTEVTKPPSPKVEDSEPVQETPKEVKKVAEPPKEFEPIDLDSMDSIENLKEFHMDHLKSELIKRGLKCGGSMDERMKRLWSIKGLEPNKYPKNILAKK